MEGKLYGFILTKTGKRLSLKDIYDQGFAAGKEVFDQNHLADLADAYKSGFRAGYHKGELAGLEHGIVQGKAEGYDLGYEEGYECAECEWMEAEDAAYSSGYDEGYETACKDFEVE